MQGTNPPKAKLKAETACEAAIECEILETDEARQSLQIGEKTRFLTLPDPYLSCFDLTLISLALTADGH